jgi:hypothetical protein
LCRLSCGVPRRHKIFLDFTQRHEVNQGTVKP